MEVFMQDSALKHTNLIIKEKKSLTIDGVENVLGFDESYVTLATVAGKINVEGEELKIQSLSGENGEIHIVGKILGVYYTGAPKSKGFLSRFFK